MFQYPTSPVLVCAVCSMVEGQRLDLIAADLTCLGLQSGRNVRLQGPILSLDGPHLQEHNSAKQLNLVCYIKLK